jgi:hypothetical protein
MTPDPVDVILQVMNELLQADPYATYSLCSQRVPCNRAVLDHPTVEAMAEKPDARYGWVGLVGILNGITQAIDGTKISLCTDNEMKPVKFVRTSEYEGVEEIKPPKEGGDKE